VDYFTSLYQGLSCPSHLSSKALGTRLPTTKTVTLIETDNRYATLAVEDLINTESSLPVENINENNNDPKPTTSYKTRQNHDVRKVNKEKKWTPQPLTQQGIEKTLVIGDSMVKNINEKKIERAARGKSICHSYSGATIYHNCVRSSRRIVMKRNTRPSFSILERTTWRGRMLTMLRRRWMS
jgi:hypothetical protein